MIIKSLVCDADLSQDSLERALIQLNYSISSDNTYNLYIGRVNITFLNAILPSSNLFHINIVLLDELNHEWYLEDVINNIIIYSKGA